MVPKPPPRRVELIVVMNVFFQTLQNHDNNKLRAMTTRSSIFHHICFFSSRVVEAMATTTRSLVPRHQFLSHCVWFQSHNDEKFNSSSLWLFFSRASKTTMITSSTCCHPNSYFPNLQSWRPQQGKARLLVSIFLFFQSYESEGHNDE